MDQGSVRAEVVWDGERIVAARVASRRPQAAALLQGRSPDAAAALAPRLFSLCAQAQGAAVRLAAAAACGHETTADAAPAVAVEAIGEHLWRLLLDWPRAVGHPAAQASFLGWRKRLLAAGTPSERAALGADLLAWLPSLALPVCPERTLAPPTALLPWCDAASWAGVDIDAAFAAAPTLASGVPAETGALARRGGVPAVAGHLAAGRRVAARLAARLADLEFLARALGDPALLDGWLDSAALGDGVGLARVETARGLLLHLMQVKDGQVARHVIVAPTEWNFHPRGAFVGEIVGSPAATRDEAERLAHRLVLALDPCVGFEVAVEDA